MQLDLTQLVSKLEAMSSLKPVPHKEFVETYVKAYYLSEPTLETWVKDHTVSNYKSFNKISFPKWPYRKMRTFTKPLLKIFFTLHNDQWKFFKSFSKC